MAGRSSLIFSTWDLTGGRVKRALKFEVLGALLLMGAGWWMAGCKSAPDLSKADAQKLVQSYLISNLRRASSSRTSGLGGSACSLRWATPDRRLGVVMAGHARARADPRRRPPDEDDAESARRRARLRAPMWSDAGSTDRVASARAREASPVSRAALWQEPPSWRCGRTSSPVPSGGFLIQGCGLISGAGVEPPS